MNKYTSVCNALASGKAIILETDTVIGIISLKPNIIYQMKQRSENKKLITFVSSIDQIPGPIPADLRVLLKTFWPGPLTVIINGVSYRMPKNNLILQVVKQMGPVYSSSANISNKSPIERVLDAFFTFIEHLGKFIMVRTGERTSGIPSTIYDYDNKRIIREGEIPHWKIFS